jgi:hypothetical protein
MRTAAIAAGITGQEDLVLAFEVLGQRGAIVGAFGRGDLIGIAFGRSLLRPGSRFAFAPRQPLRFCAPAAASISVSSCRSNAS